MRLTYLGASVLNSTDGMRVVICVVRSWLGCILGPVSSTVLTLRQVYLPVLPSSKVRFFYRRTSKPQAPCLRCFSFVQKEGDTV